jgi:hypothetical protein
MDRQKFLNDAVEGLMKQGSKAMAEDGRCRYRDARGNKCAIGQIIPDELYLEYLDDGPDSESVAVELFFTDELGADIHAVGSHIEKTYGDVDTDDVRFMTDVQAIHDSVPVEHWPERFASLARVRGLEVPTVLAAT